MQLIRAVIIFVLLWTTVCAQALENGGEALNQAGIDLQQGQAVDLSLTFLNEEGKRVTLGELVIPQRPLIIIPAYYHCPRLCGLVLTGLVETLNKIDFEMGVDYSVVTVSIDPDESAEAQREKAAEYHQKYKKPEQAVQYWHFLRGEAPQINSLMSSLGYRYAPDSGEFTHSAAFMLLTPQGEISQYFTGVTYDQRQVHLALVDAAKGRIGSVVDHVFLFCFRYDHIQGQYTWAVFNLVRLVGGVTLLFLIVLVYRLRQQEKQLKGAA